MNGRAAVGVFASLLVACGGEAPAETPDAGPPTFANVQRIFTRSCANFSVCHAANSRAGAGLVLVEGMSYEQLVGVAARQTTASRLNRVTPGEPDRSWLVLKIENAMSRLPECTPAGSTPSPCGTAMPQGNDLLPAAERAVIRQWVAMGAPR